jgi:NAD(P)-dependent dehydrogenase (short-subunit alcohol dehydrogenase family)
MMSVSLVGGVAVVTGAARGIGEGMARAAAARGMKLVLADVAAEPLQQVADDLARQGVEAVAAPTDVTDPAALDRLADLAFSRFGEVRLLVNNAGIETLGNTWDLSAAQWDRAVNVNVLGPIQGVRAFAGRMVAAQKPAAIVNVASIAAVSMMPEQTAYILSKHAVLSFSECLYLEMQRAAPMIQVSVVLPGPVATRIFTDAPAASGTGVSRHREVMDQMLGAYGMTPAEAGRTIVEQIEAGEFWIATHPDMLAASARARADYLAGLKRPYLQEDAKGILGG